MSMKYRILLIGITIFLVYVFIPKQFDFHDPKPPFKSRPIATKKVEPKLAPLAKMEINPIKKFDPPQELSHKEFVAREKEYAEERLQSLVLGWCIATQEDVRNYFLETYSKMPKSYRQEIRNPYNLCLNKKEIAEDSDWKCFTYQALCPRQFQETDDVTLLNFFSGQEVYRYERRVMDYRTYVQNPDLPAFPGPKYWSSRANDIKLLAESVRGEPMAEQTWGIFREDESLGD